MSTAVADEILGSALKQPDTDRARIAEALIASLDVSADQEIDQAWQVEAEHAEYLDPKRQPNEDWRGSQVTID